MLRNYSVASLMLLVSWNVTVVAQDISVPTDGIQPVLTLLRRHTPSYTPGESVEVTLAIEGNGIERVRALGLEERLPPGWRLVSVQGYAGTPPQIQPEPGAAVSLEFAWITPPRLPCVFSYTVTVPEKDWGEKELYGTLLYRLDAGPFRTPATITVLYGPEPDPPELVVRGDNPMELQEGDPWVDPGCIALDHNKQDISAYLTTHGTVDTSRPGTYTVEYRVTSQTTGLSASATRTVTVVVAPGEEDSLDSRPAGYTPPPRDFSPSVQNIPETEDLPPATADTGQDNADLQKTMQPRAFPELSDYQPVPRERPEYNENERAVGSVQVAGNKGGNPNKEVWGNALSTNEAGLSKNNTVKENTGPIAVYRSTIPDQQETSSTDSTGRFTPRHWIVGTVVLIVLLAGLSGAWYTAYRGPRGRTSGPKGQKR